MLTGFISILCQIVIGLLSLMLAIVIVTVGGYFAVKTTGIFISLFNYSLTEPEPKVVKKAHKAVKTK